MSASYPLFYYGAAVKIILVLLAAYGMGDASALVLVWWPVFFIFTLSRLNLGCQITFLYSKCSRTIVVKSLGKVTVPRNVKVALIKPNKRDASSTALETWALKLSSSSIIHPSRFQF